MRDNVQVWMSRDLFRALKKALETSNVLQQLKTAEGELRAGLAPSGLLVRQLVQLDDERGVFMDLLVALQEAQSNNVNREEE